MIIKKIITDERGVHVRSGNALLCEIEDENGDTSLKFIEETETKLHLGYGSTVPSRNNDDLNKEELLQSYQGCSLPMTASKKKDVWTKYETEFLLQKYVLYYPEIGPLRLFRNQKAMWEKICTEINTKFSTNKSDIQCQNKYKYESELRKKAIQNNRTSGMSPVESPHEDSFSKIESFDDSLKPEILVGIGKTERLKRPAEKDCENQSPRGKKSKLDVARELHAASEENRERRHRERCDLLKELFQKRDN